MVEMSKTSPLTISSGALERILFTKVEQKVPKEQRLRVRSTTNELLGVVAFDMHFDDETTDKDGVYQVGGLQLILDNNTAYRLIGSTLDITDEGDFEFNHLQSDEAFDPSRGIVYN